MFQAQIYPGLVDLIPIRAVSDDSSPQNFQVFVYFRVINQEPLALESLFHLRPCQHFIHVNLPTQVRSIPDVRREQPLPVIP